MYFGKRAVIYGLGKEYQMNKEFLEDFFQVIGYSDRKRCEIGGYIQPENLYALEFDYVYVSSFNYFKRIKADLVNEYGIPEDKIIWEPNIWNEKIEAQLQEDYSDADFCLELGRTNVVISRSLQRRYAPLYSYNLNWMPSKGPEIYNVEGQKMETFFIRDAHMLSDLYFSGKRFMWDRYNWGLDTHFYGSRAIFETMGNPTRKYGLMSESRAIVPKDYELLNQNAELVREFDAIFTFDDRVLDKFSNARFVPFGAGPWYGRTKKGIEKVEDNYKNKTKNISVIASNKGMCEGHFRRRNVATYCKKNHLADTYGRFDGGAYLETIEDAFEEYRYAIVMENDITSYYFTEKLTTCIAAQTVPIYLGATKIHEFFNLDGMIILSLDDLDHIEDVLKQCSVQDYESRIPAILDNYRRVQKYYNVWDDVYEKYLKNR